MTRAIGARSRPVRRAVRRPVRGVGAVAVIVVLVAMAGIAGAVVKLGQQQATTTAQEVMASRASAAARSGLEWGLWQTFKGSWTSCSNASQTLDLNADGQMRVTVSCDSRVFNEGESAPGTPASVRVFTIDAVACNGSTTCPDATAAVRQGYVERRRQVQAVN